MALTKPLHTDSARVVGYIRVSTDEQASSGAGLAAQRAAIEGECQRRGWTVLAMHEDAAAGGGSLAGRQGLLKALEAVGTGVADTLVVAKLDRLTRSVLDFANLVDRAARERWNLVALDLGVDLSTPAGSLIAGIMASIAQWERRIIGVRTKEALAARRASGAKLGRPVRVTSDVAARIARRRVEGITLQGIADELIREGVPTPSGAGSWHPSVVAGIARRAGVPSQRRGRRPRVAA
jgi:DNA invertase Pin-like site-specific DNA recombinase